MIPPRAERRKSKTLTLTAWQAAFFVLLAMSITLGTTNYLEIWRKNKGLHNG